MPCDDEPYFLSACDFRYGENELAANRLASRTLITSAPSVKYIVISDVIARLVESRHKVVHSDKIKRAGFRSSTRLCDGGGPGLRIHLHS